MAITHCTAGYKASAAVPGEYAVGYNSRTVSADTLTCTITGLVPGSNYYASVSAINAYGIYCDDTFHVIDTAQADT